MGFVEVLLELLFQIYFKFLIKMHPDESFVLLSQKYGHCIRKLLSLVFLLIMAMAGLDKFSLLSSLCLFPHLVLDIISYLDIKTVKNVRLTSRDLAGFVNTALMNKVLKIAWRDQVLRKWFSKSGIQPVIFQCEDEVSDLTFG